MRNRRKRLQREEVRKILAAMRQELAQQRQMSQASDAPQPMLALQELLHKARSQAKV